MGYGSNKRRTKRKDREARVSYPKGIGAIYLGLSLQRRKNDIHLQLLPKSRIHGSMPPHLHMSSWSSAYLVKHRNYTFWHIKRYFS
jgi:hypothetical protein